MVRIELGVEDLANTRFGISPLTETVFSLWALSDPSRHTLHLPWLRTVRGHLSPHHVTAVTGARPRINAVLSYAPAPGARLSDYTKQLFYGRTS